MPHPVWPVLLMFVAASPALRANPPPLPQADAVEWAPLGDHCAQLLLALDRLQTPVPPETGRSLRALLARSHDDPGKAVEEVQGLLEPLCLIGVSINPESRVKAAPGPADANLTMGRERIVLVKIFNQAGVTNALKVSGSQLRTPGADGPGGWLEASFASDAPLSGQRLEYRILRLRARESGKREATLKFDVGQGTQDLGFRAEVPILFSVRQP